MRLSKKDCVNFQKRNVLHACSHRYCISQNRLNILQELLPIDSYKMFVIWQRFSTLEATALHKEVLENVLL